MKILIVEDDADSRFLLKRHLSSRKHEVTACGSAEEAMTLLESDYYPMICLDMQLPQMSGLEFCEWIRGRKNGDLSYILFFTGNTNPESLHRILAAGGNDYLEKRCGYNTGLLDVRISIGEEQVKQIHERKRLENQLKKERDLISRAIDISPALIIFLDAKGHILSFNVACQELTGYTLEEVKGKVYWELPIWESEKEAFMSVFGGGSGGNERPNLRESEWRNRKGETCYVCWYFSNVLDNSGNLEFTIGAGIDITERRKDQQRLHYMAEHDPLTDLYNRSRLPHLLERASEDAKSGHPTAVLYIDLDKFKLVNDIAGHAAGDRLLVKVANLLRELARAEDQIVRFGGDEFLVILHRATLPQAKEVAERYRSRFDNFTFEDSDRTFNISLSIGLAVIDGTKTVEEILASVDASCYVAKSRGRNRVEMPRQGDSSRVIADADWSRRIKEAIRKEDLDLWYQPVVHIPSGKVHYYEALLRLRQDPSISPAIFLAAVERSGSMAYLDRHVVELALRTLRDNPTIYLSVNISGQTANDESFFSDILKAFERYGISYDRMIFEVTETALMTEPEKARILLTQLRTKGMRFALDDFGAGFSSLGYLRHLPVEMLKVDGEFIRDIQNHIPNRALVKYISQTARILKVKTVAEYVEVEECFKIVKEFGFDYAQGFLVGGPSPRIIASA